MKLSRILSIALVVLLLLPTAELPAYASTYDSATATAFDTVEDAGMGETSLALRFGTTLQEELRFDTVFSAFVFTDDLKVIGSISGSSLRIDNNAVVQGAISGRLLVISGAAAFSGTTTFKNGIVSKAGVLSGSTLRVSGNADIHGALNASGAVRTDSNLTINDDADANNAVLTFGSDATNETLTWFNSADRFQFSDDISIVGSISGSSLRIDNNAVVHGTLSASGAAIKGTMSGRTLRTTNNADIMGILSVSGAVHLDANLSLNDDQTAADTILTFGSDGVNETLHWANTEDKFKFSDDLDILGTISGTTIRSWGGVANTFSGSIITDSSFSGASFFGSGLGSCNNGTTSKLLYNPSTGKFSCGTDQTGGGTSGGGMAYADIESIFVNQGGDTMTGSLNVKVTTSDIVKTTTGTSNATDFSFAGSTLTNVTSADDAININEGTVPSSGQGTTSTSTVTTSAALGAGAHTILRDDGKYVIFLGNGSTTVNLWDGIAGGAMSAIGATTTAVGAGGMSLRRPDGRYLVIAGGGSTTANVYDPYGITANSSVTLTSCTATTGTNAFLVASGSYVIMCGGSANWGLYNGTANVYTAGTALGASFGAGAHALQRDDGSFLVFAGGNTTTHWLYTPYNNQWYLNPIQSNAPTITTGAFSIRRPDGKFLILGGAQNASTIYDPMPSSNNNGAGTMTAQSGVGFGPTAALADGAQALWRQDGKYLLMIGGSTTTNIIDVTRSDANQFTTGPTIAGGTPGAGAHMFINARGTVQVLLGGATTTTSVYDMGFILGGNYTSTGATYETECITAPSLGTGSRMEWNTDADAGQLSFQVRTGNGSCSGNYRDIQSNGDLVRPTPGHNRVQMKVIFKRSLPKFVDQEWGLRRGLGQTRYRRANKDPTLYDVSVRNTILLHRTQFEFGGSADASGPIAVNIQNDRNKNLQIALANQVAYGTTINTTQQGVYNGVFVTQPAMSTAAGVGTVVMKRPDKKFVILPGQTAGGAAGAAMIYNPDTFTSNTLTATPTIRTSTGAFAFKRPDGKFLVVVGGGSRVTNIYDPIANTFTAGPLLTQAAGEGALPIALPNGNVLVLHGGFRRSTTVYNPFTNTTMSGSTTNLVIGRGSMAIPRPNGQYMVVPGTSTQTCALQTATMLFDPYTMQFVNNTAAPITTGTGPGAFAFERFDGQWVIIKGGGTANTCAGVTATNIYNPFTNRMLVGATLAAATRHGAQALPRPDGTWLITNGGALTTTQIYYEKAGAFTADTSTNGVGIFVAGPATTAAIGTGSVAFQRDDGKFVVTAGANAIASAGTTTAMLYDAGWVTSGFYRSELMNIPDLDSSSTLSWKASPSYSNISASVRTGTSALSIQSDSSREIGRPGDQILPGTGHTWLQVTFNLARSIPSYTGIYQDVWWNGGGSTNAVTQRVITTPTITEFSVGKDSSVVDFKADNLSLFRVSSNGDVYTGNKGSLFSGGADLAERYSSPDDLKPGEVVAIDFTDSHGVRRSTSAYQPEVLGVVSTNPGFVAGAFTKGSFPIALVGRVPVKVSLENGPILTGDRLTAASMPGYAMKALRAGRTVGIALESLDMAKTEPCPEDPRKSCGVVMMFVNLSDYQGPAK